MNADNQNEVLDLQSTGLQEQLGNLIAHKGSDATNKLAEAADGALSGLDEGCASLGPATDFADIPRDEKQKAHELWNDGHFYGRSIGLERRMRRGRLQSKFALRHSQIKLAAKKRGKPWQWRKWVDSWVEIGRVAAWHIQYAMEAA